MQEPLPKNNPLITLFIGLAALLFSALLLHEAFPQDQDHAACPVFSAEEFVDRLEEVRVNHAEHLYQHSLGFPLTKPQRQVLLDDQEFLDLSIKCMRDEMLSNYSIYFKPQPIREWK
jgi:hypothetical protein